MEWAIAYAATVFAVAFALPKWWSMRMQERLVQLQIDALVPSTVGGVTTGGQSEIDWTDSPYR